MTVLPDWLMWLEVAAGKQTYARRRHSRLVRCGSVLHTPGMTAAGEHIVEDFQSLPDPEKIEVLSNLLRISRGIDYPEVSEEELVSAAEAVFLAYDERELKG